jgi:signal transduction histidine kinase
MNAIIGLANLLATTPLSPKQMEFVGTLQQSANSLLTLINDMLDITKIEENKVELDKRSPFLSICGIVDQNPRPMANKRPDK